MTDEERAAQAEQMKTALQHSEERGQRSAVAFKEVESVMKSLHLECYETFASSKVQDSEGHKTCRMYMLVLQDVEERFKKHIRNGEQARKRLIKIKQKTLLDKIK